MSLSTAALDPAAGHGIDPRPLLGEPFSLDLLNTVWLDAHGSYDLLDDLSGLRIWLSTAGLDHAPTTEATRASVRSAREALRRHIAAVAESGQPSGTAHTRDALNAVLQHGVLTHVLDVDGPRTEPVVADPAHLPAWTAVTDYLQLLARDPRRIRRCAGHGCVLHFFDVSKRGDRRWCSMAGCGNRAKAARHYARHRQSGDAG